ncbi:MAG: AraC family transcriptional regulator [Candidatus Binatia bacterium]
MDGPYIPGGVLHSFLRVAAAFGIDASTVFATAGLPVDLASLGDRFITVAEFDRLVDGFTTASGDPAFALHLGEMFNLFDLAILTTLINTSRNLAEAAAGFADFRALFNPLFHMTIAVDGARAVVAYQPTPDEPLSFQPRYPEFVLTFHLSYARWLLRQPIVVHAATFRHARPTYAAEYDRIFACPVEFSAAEDAFVVDAAVLTLPIGSAFAEYNRQAAELARAELGRLPQADVVPQVIHLIRTHLAEGAFDLERTARELGIGARTLQRRLQDVGISFSSLRDQVRSEAALVLIRRADLSIDELADRLGYAERSNFTHAFSRWTGMTPGAFRRRLLPGG